MNLLKEQFKREMQHLKDVFGCIPEEAEPMEWDEAMERRLIIPIELDAGGEMEIKINHGTMLEGGRVFK